MNEAVRERVDAALREFVGTATGELRVIGDDLVPVAEAAAEFVLAGGKRLRPAFCYWGALYAGAADCDALIRAAASLELLQACALVHDDVIDHSDTRRGRPAIHRRFADLHTREGWTGEAADFGAAAAILLGDVLLAWSDAMLAASGLDDAALRRAQPVSAAMRTEVMAGQYLDIVEQARGTTTVERALTIARLKSAKYTVERPLHLGAAIADAPPEYFAAFTSYGLLVGEAFQLHDDLLGVFGDSDLTGKPAGDDIREGKQTVLIALALDRSTPSEASRLRTALGNPALDDDTVDELRKIITSSGAEDEVRTMIKTRLSDAVTALGSGPPEAAGPGRQAFDRLVSLAEAAAGLHRS